MGSSSWNYSEIQKNSVKVILVNLYIPLFKRHSGIHFDISQFVNAIWTINISEILPDSNDTLNLFKLIKLPRIKEASYKNHC